MNLLVLVVGYPDWINEVVIAGTANSITAIQYQGTADSRVSSVVSIGGRRIVAVARTRRIGAVAHPSNEPVSDLYAIGIGVANHVRARFDKQTTGVGPRIEDRPINGSPVDKETVAVCIGPSRQNRRTWNRPVQL